MLFSRRTTKFMNREYFLLHRHSPVEPFDGKNFSCQICKGTFRILDSASKFENFISNDLIVIELDDILRLLWTASTASNTGLDVFRGIRILKYRHFSSEMDLKRLFSHLEFLRCSRFISNGFSPLHNNVQIDVNSYPIQEAASTKKQPLFLCA